MNKKVAVPTGIDEILDTHFGHCKYFTIFQVNENKVTAKENIAPPHHEPGVLPLWLAEKGVTDVLAGGMGNHAIQIFNQQNVNVFVGAPPMAAIDLVNGFLKGSIHFNANYCDH